MAFEQLYKRHSVGLLKTAYNKTGLLEAAEEIVQDTFLTFYYKKEKVQDNPLLYLKGILKYKILKHQKASDRGQTVSQEDKHMPVITGNETLEKLDAKEVNLKINECVQMLPEQCRHVFLLRREYNLSNQEVAEKMGISIKTVEAHMTKALAMLREKLEYYVYLGVLTGLQLWM